MDINKLKALKLAVPFRQFYVILDSSRRILVERPNQIAVAPDGSRIGVEDRTGVVLLRPQQISSVDVSAPARQR